MKISRPVLACLCALVSSSVCPSSAHAKPKAVKMDRALKRELNTFFSNFSEAYVAPFRRKQLSDDQMIEFAFFHEYINHHKRQVPVARVNSLANWYFGVTVKRHRLPTDHNSSESLRNGIYTHSIDDGDPMQFSQVATLTDLGNGEFAATTNDYQTHDDLDHHGAFKPVKKTDCDVWEEACFTGKHQALVKRVGTGQRRRFILLQYLELNR